MRDVEAEKRLLAGLDGHAYALLQRDWFNPGHGDLDMLLDNRDCGRFVSHLRDFLQREGATLAKVYEIQRAVVCIVVLTEHGHFQLDVCLSPRVKQILGVDTELALSGRERIDGVWVVTEGDAENYRKTKRAYKSSRWALWRMRLGNIPIYLSRLRSNLLRVPGAIVYPPFVQGREALRLPELANLGQKNLEFLLLQKYGSRIDV